jgi:hypothetical protein
LHAKGRHFTGGLQGINVSDSDQFSTFETMDMTTLPRGC